MSDNEFDLIDELYFINSYPSLRKAIDMSGEILKSTLINVLKKGWVDCYVSPTAKIRFDIKLFEKEYRKYHYLAIKAGLVARTRNSKF